MTADAAIITHDAVAMVTEVGTDVGGLFDNEPSCIRTSPALDQAIKRTTNMLGVCISLK